ncbi:MAG: ribosome maturation factor RimP [Oscillospiraceae bacterium]|jgi:ribosome maturation factor RimP|nr:ribosome maturation factor RimP [Oscillospiraceae bacterium]
MSKITDTASALAAPILEKLGLELWDVEFAKEAGAYFLRVYIDVPRAADVLDGDVGAGVTPGDAAKGITLDDCEAVSRALDPLLDEHDALFPEEGYTFEVSSAGAERKLRRPSDFARFMGHRVEIKLYKNKFGGREHIGLLRAYDTDSGDITLEAKTGTLAFEKAEIANVRLRIG